MYNAGLPPDIPCGEHQVEAVGRLPARPLQRRLRLHLANGDWTSGQGTHAIFTISNALISFNQIQKK